MQTLSAKKHEALMMNKYSEACAKWKPEQGGFPQIAFYGFHRQYGYVTFGGRTSCWRKTKAESIAAWQKANGG